MKKRNTRNFGACEDRMLQSIDRKRAVLAAIEERSHPQDAVIALFALECEGVLKHPALSPDASKRRSRARAHYFDLLVELS